MHCRTAVAHVIGFDIQSEKTITLTLQSPARIDFLSTFDFTVPETVAKSARMAGIVMSAHCNATIKARYNKVD